MIPKRVSDPRDLVRSSSPRAVEVGLKDVAKRMRRWKRWLTVRHPYNRDVIKALKPSNQQGDVDGPKLCEYIAGSAPLHLADGWNYLSRAFDAASRGDRSSAYHLAYYAELRAAMSLLATEGIGIFNRRHISLDSHLQPTEYRDTTHGATWAALDAWSREPDRAARLLGAISIESQSLSGWLEAVGVVHPSQQLVAQEWLRVWSIDLRVLSDDQQRRNDMSYRPTRIRTPSAQSVDANLELVDPIFDAWAELQPETSGTSAALDLSLLRQALTLVVEKGLCSFFSFSEALESLGEAMPTLTHQALSTERASSVAIFRNAEIEDFQGKAATPILARALLMLRLASASTASLLATASVSKSDLAFWWSPLGTDLGFWDSPDDIEVFSDLWIDVGEAKEEAHTRLSAMRGQPSVRPVAQVLARDVSLTQFSRAQMWLLGLD